MQRRDSYRKRLANEFSISRELSHLNVIQTIDLIEDAEGCFYGTMEFCPGGDLFALVQRAGTLEVQEADCFFKQLMHGVQYVHEMGVAHRDLKPENLLLSSRGKLKISDFGNSVCFRTAWETDARTVTGMCGSGPYIAPEACTECEYDSRAVDVWACGIIYMVMRNGCYPWHIALIEEDDLYGQYLIDRRQEDGFASIESMGQVGLPGRFSSSVKYGVRLY